MFFVFLIRCANESPPWLIVWLKSSRHPIPHETSCLRFFFSFFSPGHVNARSNASLVGGDTTLILLRHRELYILRWRKGREHGVLRILHVCNGTSVNTHPRSSSWKLLPPQSSPCLRRNLCGFFFFFLPSHVRSFLPGTVLFSLSNVTWSLSGWEHKPRWLEGLTETTHSSLVTFGLQPGQVYRRAT